MKASPQATDQAATLSQPARFIPAAGLLFCLVFAWGAGLRLYGLTGPFPDNYHGYNASYMSLSARNWVRHGPWRLQFFQVVDGGPLVAGSEVYTHHPPLVPLLVWLGFAATGTSGEWVARLVPITFSLGTLVLLFLLVRRLWGERVALLASFFYALLPYATYFANDVCYETGTQFFFLLVVYFYIRYMESQSPWPFVAMCAGLVLGALNDWPAFFTVPILGLHWLFWFPGRRRLYCLWYPALAAALAGIIFWFIARAEGTWLIPQITGLFRPGGQSAHTPAEVSYTAAQWFRIVVMGYMRYYVVWPVLALALMWGLGRLRAGRRPLTTADAVLLILLSFGALYVALGRSWAYSHPYWATVLLPGLCAAAAVALRDLWAGLGSRGNARAAALWAAGLLAFGLFCSYRLYRLHAHTTGDYRAAQVLKENTQFHDHILLSYTAGDPMVLRFYADRNIGFGVQTPEAFLSLYRAPYRMVSWAAGPPLETIAPDINYGRPGPAYRYFFFPDEHRARLAPLHRLLTAAFRGRPISRFTLFDLNDPLVPEGEVERLATVTQ